MTTTHWIYALTEPTYKLRGIDGSACDVFLCPYCRAERRVPVGRAPMLDICMECNQKIDPVTPIK